MATYEQVTYNSPDGAVIGSSASEKVAFHGATPVVQAAYSAQQTIAALSVSGVVGFTSSTSLSSVVEKLNAILTVLIDKGFMAAS